MSKFPQPELMPLAFNDSLVRVRKDEQGNPWFIVKDVCAVLDLSNVTVATSSLDEDERGSVILNTLGGEQEMLTVSESGLYSLIFRSRKPEARAFRRWVTGEVLPALRKTGSYGQTAQPVMTPGNTSLAELRRLVALWAMLTNMPSQSLFDQLCSMFGLQDEANDQQTLNAAALHVLQQNNTLLAQGRKVGEQAVARYQREIQIMAEPPMLKLFWQQFHALNTEGKLNHSRNPDLIALRLAEVVQAAKAQDICPFTVTELRRLLPQGSTHRLMAASKEVNSALLGKTVRCMVFFQPQNESGASHE